MKNEIIIKKFTSISGVTVVLAWYGGRLFSVTVNNTVTFIRDYKDATAAYLDAVYNINGPFQSANVWTEWDSLPEIFGRNSKCVLINKFSRRCQLRKSWDDFMEF